MPDGIASCSKLKHIELRGNELEQFPQVLCTLTRLHTLDIRDNRHINSLPKDISKLRKLTNLQLDCDLLIMPPPEVARQGARAVVAYFKPGTGQDESESDEEPSKSRRSSSGSDGHGQSVSVFRVLTALTTQLGCRSITKH